jgi:hypothetical protein
MTEPDPEAGESRVEIPHCSNVLPRLICYHCSELKEWADSNAK